VAEHRRPFDGAELLGAGKRVGAPLPEAEVEVTTRARPAGHELGHEGDAEAEPVGDLFEALLEDRVPVGHLERLGVPDVELVLAKPPLPFGVLHRDARVAQVTPDPSGEGLLPGALEDVVVLQVPAGRF
jgi:hypothetical protein